MLDIFPTPKHKNIVILTNGAGSLKDFMPFISNVISGIIVLDSDTQCFPLYNYIQYNTQSETEKLTNCIDKF